MPGLDGCDAAQQIKTQASTAGIQPPVIIVLSASALEEERIQILAAECDHFLSKPFKEAEIFDVLHKYLGIQFVYEETTVKVNDTEAKIDQQKLKSEMALLSADWQADFQESIVALDTALMTAHIDQIRPQHEWLANALTGMVNNFEYDRILALLQGSKHRE